MNSIGDIIKEGEKFNKEILKFINIEAKNIAENASEKLLNIARNKGISYPSTTISIGVHCPRFSQNEFYWEQMVLAREVARILRNNGYEEEAKINSHSRLSSEHTIVEVKVPYIEKVKKKSLLKRLFNF